MTDDREIIRLQERDRRHDERETELVARIATLEREMQEMRHTIARGHGIFIAVVGVGTFIGWALTQVSAVIGIRR